MGEEGHVEGWEVPVCKPLTRRVMFLGVPYAALSGLGVLGFQFVNFGLWPFLVLLPVLFVLLRMMYGREEWAVTIVLEQIQSSFQGKHRMEA